MILTNILLGFMFVLLLVICVQIVLIHKLLDEKTNDVLLHPVAHNKKKPRVENGLYKRTRKVREVGNS